MKCHEIHGKIFPWKKIHPFHAKYFMEMMKNDDNRWQKSDLNFLCDEKG